MKKPIEMLNEIKSLLGIELSTQEIKLEEMKLENGTVIEAEKFEKGNEVFIKTEDEKVAIPEGVYDLEDGRKMIIIEDGLLDDIVDSIEEKTENQENMKEDFEEKKEEKEEMTYATKEELTEVKSMVEEIKAMVEKMADHKEKEKEEMAEMEVEAEELKQELSKAAADPIKHNPESEAPKRQALYSQNRQGNTLDRVLSRISNIKN